MVREQSGKYDWLANITENPKSEIKIQVGKIFPQNGKKDKK